MLIQSEGRRVRWGTVCCKKKLLIALACQGCLEWSTTNEGPETIAVHCLTDLEGRSPRWRLVPVQAMEKRCPWFVYGHRLPVPSCPLPSMRVCLWMQVSPLYKAIIWDESPTEWPHLHSWDLQWLYFQGWSCSEAVVVRTSRCEWRRTQFDPQPGTRL